MKKYKIILKHKTIANMNLDAEYCEAENKAEAIRKVKTRLRTWNNVFTSHFNFKAFDVTERDTLTIGYVNEFGN